MRRTGLLAVAIAAVTIVIGGCSKGPSEEHVGGGVAVGTGGAAANVNSDAEFVHDVAILNMLQIQLSRIAVEKATSPDIKFLAQRIMDDHGSAGHTLESVVSGGSIDWPDQLDDEHSETRDELAAKQGTEFDLGYAEAIIEGHQDLAALLESRLDVQSVADWKTAAAGRTRDQALPDPKVEMPDVQLRPNESGDELTMKINRWAAGTYPIAHKHLDTARMLENATKKRSTN